jgi:putative tryptophan/tyrosine transport system permease protein
MLSEWLIIQGIIERGLIFSITVMSIYLTTRIIRFDDLSVEGSFGLGGALMALLLTRNISWFFAFPVVIIAGAVAGLATGLLHTKLKLNNLISGIVVTTALFSINLKIAGSNMIVGNKTTFFDLINTHNMKIILLLPLICGLLLVVKWFLRTECGFLLNAVGDNPQMLTNLGKNADTYIIAALMLANGLTAFAGALFVQYVGYFSIWSSVGILIIALAGLILSETLGHVFSFNLLIGAILYQAIIAATFEFNVDPEWNKLITALLIIVMITIKSHFHPTFASLRRGPQ